MMKTVSGTLGRMNAGNFRDRMWGDKVNLEKRRIKAYRDVGVAFGQNQQPRYDVLWVFGR